MESKTSGRAGDSGALDSDRLAELREATEGPGCRHRVHRLTNDELVALLDAASDPSATLREGVPTLAAETITDADIRVFLDESRFCGDNERARAALAALGHRHGDGALGILDKDTCRARVAEIILREHTPGTSAARTVILREGSPGSGRFA